MAEQTPPRLSSNAVLLSAGSSRSEDSRGRLDSTESYDYDNGAVVDPMATILDLTPEEQAQRIERTQSWDVTSPVIGPTASPLNPPVGAAPAERNNTPEPRPVPGLGADDESKDGGANSTPEIRQGAQAMQQVEPPPFNLDDEPPNEPTPPGLFNSLCARMCCARGARAPS